MQVALGDGLGVKVGLGKGVSVTGESVVVLVDEDRPEGQFIGIHDQFAQSPIEFVTPDTDPEQYSHFHFTSGSTGKPKAVQHCHAAIIDHMRSFEAVM